MSASTVDGIELTNSLGLSDEYLGLLWSDWSRLSKVVPDVAEPALRFIVDGDHGDVLNRLKQTAGCGSCLGLHGCVDWQNKGGDRKARLAFFKNPPVADAAFYHRLAQAHDAAATADRKSNRKKSAVLPEWVNLMLVEATSDEDHSFGGYHFYGKKAPAISFGADQFEQMILAGGGDAALLAKAAFLGDPRDWAAKHAVSQIVRLRGFAQMASRHGPVIAEALNHAEADIRIHALDLMLREKLDPSPFAERIIELAVSSAKTVRKAAELLLDAIPQKATELLRKKAQDGSNDERLLKSGRARD